MLSENIFNNEIIIHYFTCMIKYWWLWPSNHQWCTLTFAFSPPAVPVTITAHPTDSTLLVNDNATFTCSAYGTTPITLTWYRVDSGAAPTRIDNGVSRSQTGSTEVTVTSTVTLPSIGTADDGAMFYCEATNNLTDAGVFTNQSDSATLTVQCESDNSTIWSLCSVGKGRNPLLAKLSVERVAIFVFSLSLSLSLSPAVPIIAAISPEVIGLVNTELMIGITIENDYPNITEAQITWYHQRNLDTPLTSAANSRYMFSTDMQSLTITQLTYDDEGNYTIVVGHVTGNQNITIQVNVQGEPSIPFHRFNQWILAESNRNGPKMMNTHVIIL